ncbi:MAG: zinc ribbon domain-containing protein [Proteobacteria bacterium]|jgi:putative FmdB family regulatory protein|nr:zinc ribbon domain-containing protein [Pseudomonadota bacterium]
MPIYEYECQVCGHRLEALQKISDAPLTECPACGEPQLKKLVSAAAFRLKGGGWYETDFKTGGKKNLAGSGDDKPAAKPAKKEAKKKTGKKGTKASKTAKA